MARSPPDTFVPDVKPTAEGSPEPKHCLLLKAAGQGSCPSTQCTPCPRRATEQPKTLRKCVRGLLGHLLFCVLLSNLVFAVGLDKDLGE
jgi:hypothetical protein